MNNSIRSLAIVLTWGLLLLGGPASAESMGSFGGILSPLINGIGSMISGFNSPFGAGMPQYLGGMAANQAMYINNIYAQSQNQYNQTMGFSNQLLQNDASFRAGLSNQFQTMQYQQNALFNQGLMAMGFGGGLYNSGGMMGVGSNYGLMGMSNGLISPFNYVNTSLGMISGGYGMAQPIPSAGQANTAAMLIQSLLQQRYGMYGGMGRTLSAESRMGGPTRGLVTSSAFNPVASGSGRSAPARAAAFSGSSDGGRARALQSSDLPRHQAAPPTREMQTAGPGGGHRPR